MNVELKLVYNWSACLSLIIHSLIFYFMMSSSLYGLPFPIFLGERQRWWGNCSAKKKLLGEGAKILLFFFLKMVWGGGGRKIANICIYIEYSRPCVLLVVLSEVVYHSETEDFTFLGIQSSDFVSKAVDVAVKELIAVATPGEGLPI